MPRLTQFQATYRCLQDVTLDFTSPEDGEPSPFIALVGANGTGKTTILEAIARSACRVLGHPAFSLMRGYGFDLTFADGILRMGMDDDGTWNPKPNATISQTELKKILYIRSGYLPTIPVNAPLARGLQHDLLPALALLVDDAQARIAAVHQWWLHRHFEYPKTTTLDRLWYALEPFLDQLVYAGPHSTDHLPYFDARGTTVTFNELSSGERRLILLFMEITMQCGEDGLVLFDEPEAHFHPNWQRMLPHALQQLEPRGQIIVATHAPHIVEGLPSHQVFTLGDQPW